MAKTEPVKTAKKPKAPAAAARSVPAKRSRKSPLKSMDFQETVDDVPAASTEASVAPVSAAPAPRSASAEPAKSLAEEIAEVLASQLRVSVEDGDFTDPNRRTLKLFLGKKCISQTSFDVRSRREYEG